MLTNFVDLFWLTKRGRKLTNNNASGKYIIVNVDKL